ncbi:MAG: BREX-1 system adenine-specific DNA-methyltransferase PglX [Myxococcota bacterium]|jgi:SAM-dependent methyltransferase|nr:BREX-1 system adenine-specific DNA-methyltransferase PglX [Myxococcota bacterium]
MQPEQKKILKAVVLDLRHQLEGWYDSAGAWHAGDLENRLASLGVRGDRKPAPTDELTHLPAEDRQARKVVDAYLELRLEAGVEQQVAVTEFLRETAYTWANRLLALRCMEARELIDEVILQKEVYGGRSLEHNRLAKKHPELCSGADDGLFAVLDRVFTRQAERLPHLFDPRAPGIKLRPSPSALKSCLALLSGTRAARGQEPATAEVFQAPDALGWAYQYWNNEEKDRVFEKVRTQKGTKIEGADIIPATQLYTEPYMVKFLVQNSLGATWVGMHPKTELVERWEYFVKDADRAPVPKVKPVSEITFLDPACGSGHFLLEAFDLYYGMYEEEGQVSEPEAICRSILQHNLFGIDIDERATQIAEAALWMKAAEKAFDFPGVPMNLVATNLRLPAGKDHLKAYLQAHPEDRPLQPALEVVFEGLQHADELGSLLQIEEPVERELKHLDAQRAKSRVHGAFVQMELGRPAPMIQGELPVGVESFEEWKAKALGSLEKHFAAEAQGADLGQAFFGRAAEKGLRLFEVLARRYDVVTANPPYMGSKNMGDLLKKYMHEHYYTGRRDLFSGFMIRCAGLSKIAGRIAMVTQQSWMFLRSFKDLRCLSGQKKDREEMFGGLLVETSIESLVHLGEHAFEDVSAAGAFAVLLVMSNRRPTKKHCLKSIRLLGQKSPDEKRRILKECISGGESALAYHAPNDLLLRLPEKTLTYWLDEAVLGLFMGGEVISDVADTSKGLGTCNDARFVRCFWEIQDGRWRLLSKGGQYKKWSGCNTYVVDYYLNGIRMISDMNRKFPYLNGNLGLLIHDPDWYVRESLVYSEVGRGSLGVRYKAPGAIVGHRGPAIYPHPEQNLWELSVVLNSRLLSYLFRCVSGTLLLDNSYLASMPYRHLTNANLASLGEKCYQLSSAEESCSVTEYGYDEKCSTESSSLGCSIESKQLDLMRIRSVRHSIEGFLDGSVMVGYGIGKDNLRSIYSDTGAPAGNFSTVIGYDMPIDGLPQVVADAICCHSTAVAGDLTTIKRRLRSIYEAGNGAFDSDGEFDSTDDDQEEVVAVGAYIPIPCETFVEEIAQKVEIHPLSVYWLLKEGIEQEGWRCRPEEQRITADRFTVNILRLLGHRWPKQIEADEPVPDWADRDGIIPLTEWSGEPTLLERVRERIAADFPGGDVTRVEQEFAEVMGTTLERWLEAEFFKHHVRQFKKRPIAWQLQSGKFGKKSKPAFACMVYYHRLDGDLLPKIRSHYVGPLRQRLETELRGIDATAEPQRTERQKKRRVDLDDWIQELIAFDAKLAAVAAEGFASPGLNALLAKEKVDDWCSPDGVKPAPADREAFLRQEQGYLPDINDGVRVNVAPLQKIGLLAADVLAKKDLDKAIADRAEWRSDERRWCREKKLPRPGWWPGVGEEG